MNIRIPVPKPTTSDDASAPPSRGGVDDEELRRVERRAERFVSDQGQFVEGALQLKQQQEFAALVRQNEAHEARAILARADTLKAEANTRVAIFIATGLAAALVLGPVLLAPLLPRRPPS